MKCPKCGLDVAENTVHCPHDGTRVSPHSETPIDVMQDNRHDISAQEKGGRGVRAIILALAAIVALIAVGVGANNAVLDSRPPARAYITNMPGRSSESYASSGGAIDKMMMETTESAFGESETVQISDDFVSNAATSLGVPMNSEYSYSMSDAWYASEFDAYVVPIEFMYNGQTIASADCDLEGHPVRNINPNRAES